MLENGPWADHNILILAPRPKQKARLDPSKRLLIAQQGLSRDYRVAQRGLISSKPTPTVVTVARVARGIQALITRNIWEITPTNREVCLDIYSSNEELTKASVSYIQLPPDIICIQFYVITGRARCRVHLQMQTLYCTTTEDRGVLNAVRSPRRWSVSATLRERYKVPPSVNFKSGKGGNVPGGGGKKPIGYANPSSKHLQVRVLVGPNAGAGEELRGEQEMGRESKENDASSARQDLALQAQVGATYVVAGCEYTLRSDSLALASPTTPVLTHLIAARALLKELIVPVILVALGAVWVGCTIKSPNARNITTTTNTHGAQKPEEGGERDGEEAADTHRGLRQTAAGGFPLPLYGGQLEQRNPLPTRRPHKSPSLSRALRAVTAGGAGRHIRHNDPLPPLTRSTASRYRSLSLKIREFLKDAQTVIAHVRSSGGSLHERPAIFYRRVCGVIVTRERQMGAAELFVTASTATCRPNESKDTSWRSRECRLAL
ncbi:hypothetical protein B0H16DRAFT_1781543 [Mycena metata]|uniref:Uncharacterized protein n=1 Tax=Mycena metata TaxID=1033252 RepID=A0AAD7HQQ1_9AGAR|nr:hypothetical protein B0H16DRAFT_1781543 [Mycena metata]